eukprot:TRINITY_DN958_c0_g1_i2.p1 TRINITY_DN958_c0_g1~~TRINITY_DN958_c0_g1_i2.p1  ORF type:complete len:192 (-),score=37.65 TRINITY_DN958_c0_g1_i2:339-872(-)
MSETGQLKEKLAFGSLEVRVLEVSELKQWYQRRVRDRHCDFTTEDRYFVRSAQPFVCLFVCCIFKMNFCRECNNMLYPKEDKMNRVLLLACRNCDHQEEATNPRVYRNEIKHTAEEKTTIVQDVSSDPTLPRTKSTRCQRCGHREAVFFQAASGSDEGMTLFFVCCNTSCGNRWTEQ